MPLQLQPEAMEHLTCFKRLIKPSSGLSSTMSPAALHYNHLFMKYQLLMRRIRYSRAYIAINASLTLSLLLLLVASASVSAADARDTSEIAHQQQQQRQHHQQAAAQQPQQQQQVAQPRSGGLEPGDYIDEAGELDVMANQQQIPTAQLMAAAGHIVPDNFFLPGGSIPALYSRGYGASHHHHPQQHQQQQQIDPLHHVASHVQAAHVGKYMRPADLIAAAANVADQHDTSPLIDFNGYNMATQQEARDAAGGSSQVISSPNAAMELADFLGQANHQQQMYEQQQQHYAEQQLVAELAALNAAAAANHQQHQQQTLDNSAQSSQENTVVEALDGQNIGPAYQISSGQQQQESQQQQQYYERDQQQQKPFGLPTKSSNKEPSGMLKPLGNPKTVSSPAIDFIANQLPKTTGLEKLAEKLPQPQSQPPTVFSFSSSKDPIEKVKAVNQKKRNVMRQAEQFARMMIKSVNEKFGTTIGDQTDIPFLLSSLGPLGMAQNLLFDPTLLVTLLNSAEKTYFSDVLPGPAKMGLRPILNIFRVPNKKRDKANLLNIISFLASGGQTPNPAPKHRQGTGVEKTSKNKSS